MAKGEYSGGGKGRYGNPESKDDWTRDEKSNVDYEKEHAVKEVEKGHVDFGKPWRSGEHEHQGEHNPDRQHEGMHEHGHVAPEAHEGTIGGGGAGGSGDRR